MVGARISNPGTGWHRLLLNLDAEKHGGGSPSSGEAIFGVPGCGHHGGGAGVRGPECRQQVSVERPLLPLPASRPTVAGKPGRAARCARRNINGNDGKPPSRPPSPQRWVGGECGWRQPRPAPLAPRAPSRFPAPATRPRVAAMVTGTRARAPQRPRQAGAGHCAAVPASLLQSGGYTPLPKRVASPQLQRANT